MPSHKIQRYNNAADEVKSWTCQQRVSKAFQFNVVNYSMHSFNTFAQISLQVVTNMFDFAWVSGRGLCLYLADYFRYILFAI